MGHKYSRGNFLGYSFTLILVVAHLRAHSQIDDFGYSNACGTLSTRTFMHTGYTGTLICVDPEFGIWTVLLSNRVYGCQGQACATGSSDPIHAVERAFNSLVKDTVISLR